MAGWHGLSENDKGHLSSQAKQANLAQGGQGGGLPLPLVLRQSPHHQYFYLSCIDTVV